MKRIMSVVLAGVVYFACTVPVPASVPVTDKKGLIPAVAPAKPNMFGNWAATWLKMKKSTSTVQVPAQKQVQVSPVVAKPVQAGTAQAKPAVPVTQKSIFAKPILAPVKK